MDDEILLRRYAREGDEAAFRELARRYGGLVYAACLRDWSRTVVLEFTALAPRLEDVAGKHADVSFLTVSTDRDAALPRLLALRAGTRRPVQDGGLAVRERRRPHDVRDRAPWNSGLALYAGRLR